MYNLKIHKWSDVKSIAINVEWNAGQRTILGLENYRIAIGLQWMWKEVQESNSGQHTISKSENDRMASRLQSMWKEMQDNAQFENSQIIAGRLQWMCKEIWDNSQTIGLLVNCNECGNRCRTMHFFKVKKW